MPAVDHTDQFTSSSGNSFTVNHAGSVIVFGICTSAGESGVTFNGIACTLITQSPNDLSSLYYITGIAPGTYTFAFTGAFPGSFAAEVTGVNAANPIGDIETFSGSGVNGSVTMHPQGASGVYFSINATGQDAQFISTNPGNGQTNILSVNTGSSDGRAYGAGYLVFSSNSNQVLGYSTFNANTGPTPQICGVEIKGIPAATNGAFLFNML